ncbi:MAG: DUF2147 domain-containing protein [Myxococcota bacterium]
MKTSLTTRLLRTVTVAGALLLSLPAWAADYVGTWKTIDDESGKPRSKVKIYEQNGQLFGQIVHLYRDPGEEPDPVCDECTDSRKDQKVNGMVIITGMSPVKEYWGNGQILDPGNGKIYNCTMWLEESDPNTLNVRGDIGLSFLSRTQQWKRVE